MASKHIVTYHGSGSVSDSLRRIHAGTPVECTVTAMRHLMKRYADYLHVVDSDGRVVHCGRHVPTQDPVVPALPEDGMIEVLDDASVLEAFERREFPYDEDADEEAEWVAWYQRPGTMIAVAFEDFDGDLYYVLGHELDPVEQAKAAIAAQPGFPEEDGVVPIEAEAMADVSEDDRREFTYLDSDEERPWAAWYESADLGGTYAFESADGGFFAVKGGALDPEPEPGDGEAQDGTDETEAPQGDEPAGDGGDPVQDGDGTPGETQADEEDDTEEFNLDAEGEGGTETGEDAKPEGG